MSARVSYARRHHPPASDALPSFSHSLVANTRPFALKLKFGRADKRLVALVRRIDNVENLERVLASVETATTIDDVRQVCTA
jgi:hypothetical protein